MIRKFEKNDINPVMQIWKNENIKAHKFISKEYWKNNYNYVKEILPNAEIYVYVLKENIVGFIGINENYIEGIFIDTNNQCKGIGTSLLNKVKENRDNLTLSVYKKNINAINFYKKNDFIITSENIDEDTLLIVVDTHKKNYVESEEILEKCPKVVIIDHHRRSADFIENATLMFQEVYASSAAELVTELLQYATQKVDLKTIEAESLYAGIMMDTKNFTFKTGVRTFEAAAYLRRCGVDIIRVKKWFQSDLESFNKIADIVKKAEIVNKQRKNKRRKYSMCKSSRRITYN